MDIQTANQRAQAAFHDALVALESSGAWDPILEDAYLDAEADVRWEESKAEMDRLLTEDHDYHRTTGRRVAGCTACATPARIFEGCE